MKIMDLDFRAIEGDFLETKEDMIFDVKGLSHPPNRIIAYVRYIPIDFFIKQIDVFLAEMINSTELNSQYKMWSNGFSTITEEINEKLERKEFKIIVDNINDLFGFNIEAIRFRIGFGYYFKVYDMQSRFDILSMIKSEYIFSSKYYYFPFQAVPAQNIKKIHKPEDFIQKLLNKSLEEKSKVEFKYKDKFKSNNELKFNKFNKNLLDLIEIFKENTNIELGSIGLTGSGLVGLSGDVSDIDLTIYGIEETKKVRNLLKKILITENFTGLYGDISQIHPYSDKQLKKHYDFRAKSFNIPIKNFIFYEKRKLHQFYFDETEVFIRYLKFNRSENRHFDKFNEYYYGYVGRIELNAILRDIKDSMFTPASYLIDNIQLDSININLEEKYKKSFNDLIKNDEFKILKLITMRGRFIEQAIINEKVKICGKLEFVLTENQDTSKFSIENLRIIVGIDKRDKFYPINIEN